MRTLVIGAGIAGLTLAGRLCQQGRSPTIVERSEHVERGYAIGLYPLGSRVLHGPGTYELLRERALALERYELANEAGEILQAFDVAELTGATGPLLMVARSELVRLLEEACAGADLRRATTVRSLIQDEADVEVSFDDGSSARFDAVVACDGIRSPTRDRAFGAARGYDSGWLLWTWWTDAEHFAPTVAREWWGAGTFFGAYPVLGRVMCAAGGPARVVRGDDMRAVLRHHLRKMIDHESVIGVAIEDLPDAHAWPMADVRSQRWVNRRVALCGDAAVGFMPTAGVGASNAMRSAAALADELSRADAASTPLALSLYEKRCRSIVERNQTDSRRLARVMFVRSAALAKARDIIVRHASPQRVLGHIVENARQPF